MSDSRSTRRQFLSTSAALAAAALAGAAFAQDAGTSLATGATSAAMKRTAIDQVMLGKTGIKLSRLGMGHGPNNGRDQLPLGKDGFVKLVRSAYDRGITYFDTCDRYNTVDWIADSIKGLPREKLFIQSKITGQPADVLAAIDTQRKKINTDYIDSMLIHSQTVTGWTGIDSWKRVMDGFSEAKDRKWIRARGVSCHNVPALQAASESPWCEVHLVRVNPMGKYTDGPSGGGYNARETNPIDPVLAEIKSMHEKGRGVIGMKIIGNGLFTDPADRDKSIRFAMSNPNIDAVVIGFKNETELDDAIERINRALAET